MHTHKHIIYIHMQLGWTGMLTHPQQIAGSMFLATVLQHVASNRIIFDSHPNIVCFFGALFTTRYLKQAASDIYDLKFGYTLWLLRPISFVMFCVFSRPVVANFDPKTSNQPMSLGNQRL